MCGGISYLVSDVPASGVTVLTTSELTVSAGGLVSAWTSVAGSVGSHTVTVTVKLTNYPSVTLSKSFILTIDDPCTSTTLTWTGSLTAKTFALGNVDSSHN